MTVAPVQRREPMQARSRLTVTRILDAAAAIADEEGVDATTTRAIADRAGVKGRGEPEFLFYDTPFTLPWNRRNEVALVLD